MRKILEEPHNELRTTTACLLAAGTGSRLRPLTDSIPKCLTEINGKTILERLVWSLRQQGFKRLVVVVGHLEHRIRSFLDAHAGDMVVEYVRNPLYRTTNNIYSLWLAGELIQEPFLLVESDLIFESSLLKPLLIPDKIAVSHVLPWMNGTTVLMTSTGRVASFKSPPAVQCSPIALHRSGVRKVRATSARDTAYKTVNICSLSSASWTRVLVRLERALSDGRVNDYYEAVFAEMVSDGSLSLECVLFGSDQWYEVDKLEDLRGAERIARQIAKPVRSLEPVFLESAGARA